MRLISAVLATWLVPSLALACGGFFCNNAAPVTQAAERILFAPGDAPGRWQMHVQVTWGGTAAEFGWLLPAPPDVEVGISDARMFQQLDQLFAPRFRVTFEDPCPPALDMWANDAWADAAVADAGPPQPPPVQVLSREAIGPYDQVILQAERADDLLAWLTENGFNAPVDAPELLQPYLDGGSVFVALKLLPDADVVDIAPLRLEFAADQPTVPIIPTAVAAEPDMGIIVHIIGAHRAVPTNYLHVQINEQAIDWFGGGRNYPDVVSQAADEAGGQAFATDFAGPIDDRHRRTLRRAIYDDEWLAAIEQTEEFRQLAGMLSPIEDDLIRALADVITPPEGITVRQMFDAPWEHVEHPVDGSAVAAAIRGEVNPARERFNSMFDHPYLTRLYTTLSPAEMQLDPLFDLNPDLVDDVENLRRATFRPDACGSQDGELFLSDGTRMRVIDRTIEGVIERQGGVLVRGEGTPGAAEIARHHPAGQPEVIEITPETSMQTEPPIEPAPREEDAGCGNCATGGGAPVVPLLCVGLIVALRRRRRA